MGLWTEWLRSTEWSVDCGFCCGPGNGQD